MRKIVGLFHLTGKDSSIAKENAQKFLNNQVNNFLLLIFPYFLKIIFYS